MTKEQETESVSSKHKIALITPAQNEEDSIGVMLNSLPKEIFTQIIVVDNNSSDNTAKIAKDLGAKVVFEKQEGYGKACLSGIKALDKEIEIVVFMDADNADDPEDISKLISPIINNEHDFVLGSRIKGERESGAMSPVQIFGSYLASFLINLFWGCKYSDLGPFRAIKKTELEKLEMIDEDFGWTVEMQIKAIVKDLRILEVPVSYRKRIGISKISGTLKGVVLAGTKIIYTIFKYLLILKSTNK